MHPFLEAARDRVIVVDGAMGVSIQNRDLSLDDFDGLEGCNEVLVRTRPDVIEELHAEFLDVGCDAIETDSFGGAPWVLDEYDLGDETEELNRLSAEIARRAADAAEGDRWVLGSIGPGTRSPTLSLTKPRSANDWIDFDTMVAGYERQSRGLLAGGSDALIIETCFDLLQVKTAVVAAHQAMAAEGVTVPIIVSVTIEQGINTMLLGSEIGAAVTTLDPLGVDVIGMNCATGPEDMREHVRYLSEHSRKPISIIPNAGIPEMVDGETCYPLDPPGLAAAHREFVSELGVSIVGGCCGTTPEHLRQVVEAVRGLTPAPREPEFVPAVASLYSSVPFEQENSFHIIGERLNANGSKKFREHLLEGDLEQMLTIAKTQTGEGANSLDVCVDYVGRDGVADMDSLVSHLATKSTLPLVVDSTETDVVETALKKIGGRAIINSINLEDGRKKPDQLFPMAKKYGAAVICLAIDEEGQARTADWKVDVCKRIADIGIGEYGLDASDLIFDTLTFPLTTGDEDLRKDGMATLDAIERIKELVPGCQTTLGLSNVSFGLNPAARQVLNSVMLAEALDRGLDSAIVHASKILPLAKIDDEAKQVCLDLIYDRRGTEGKDGTAGKDYDPLQALMGLFEGVEQVQSGPKLDELDLEERLKQRIIDGERDGLPEDLDEAMASGIEPLDIINVHLLAGMKVVGDRFGAGEMQLPFVLQSAETMKAAVAHLEPHMEEEDSSSKARVVLATVKGDVHDIGKNLVDIILSNNGYEVKNIGIKQPIDAIIDAAEDFGADAIGLSGLLVKSTVVMKDDLEEMVRRGLDHYPVLLGGAALTRNYVEIDLRERYGGPLFYCRDAFGGLKVMDEVAAKKAGEEIDEDWGRVIGTRRVTKTNTDEPGQEGPKTSDYVENDVARDVAIPEPPFWGTRVTRGLPLDDVATYLNKTTLFRNQWGFDRDQADEGEARLREIMAKVRSESLLVPEAVHGYFPCNADGNDLIVWDGPGSDVEAARFTFPRQTRGKRLAIPDFFRTVDSGEQDVIAFHAVTMGRRVSEHAQELFENDEYTDYLFLHGIGVEMAEALAEMWHKRIREELDIAQDDADDVTALFKQGYQGSRYSFGYAACPDLEARKPVFDLLDAGRIGLELSEEFQLVPEQSTDAFIVHHPEAKYFNAR